MKTTEIKRGFDCVEFKQRAQECIYEKIRGLSPEDEIRYFRRAVEGSPLARWWGTKEIVGKKPLRRRPRS